MQGEEKAVYGECHFCHCEVTSENISKEAKTLMMKVMRKIPGAKKCPPVCRSCAKEHLPMTINDMPVSRFIEGVPVFMAS